MDDQYISIVEFCDCHQLEYNFIDSLNEHGLLQVVIIEDVACIQKEQIQDLERMVRLHYDLEINLQGIDAINHLLSRVMELQNEVQTLKNRLGRFEG